jgi:Zn-dependent M28 family amino/carboxypeptidase
VLGSIAILTALMVGAPTVAAADPPTSAACDARTNNNHQKLLECVTLEGVREHQAALQAIADANDGTRLAGTPGYTESVEYVVERMTAAGYDVSLNPFPFVFVPPAVLQQISPISATYQTGAFTGTGYGTVTAAVTAVDIVLAPPRDPVTSGCAAADFVGFPAGNIALIQRGTCAFADKALNAEAAGASAVIIFNQGNTPTREGVIIGTLGGADIVDIPVVAVILCL